MEEKGRGSRRIAHGIQDELRTQIPKYEEFFSKHVITKKELLKVKRSVKGRINTDKGIIDFLKKKDNLMVRLFSGKWFSGNHFPNFSMFVCHQKSW
jgi:hypothetical protein